MKKLAALLVSAALVTGLTACGNAGNNASTAGGNTSTAEAGSTGATKDTLAVGLAAAPQTLNPVTAGDAVSWQIIFGSYEALVTGQEVENNGNTYVDRTEIGPDLATSWEQDGETYTFHLNEEAVFSNGDPVTADDFLASVKYYEENNNLMYLLMDVASIEAVDEHTVQITINKPNDLFLSCLSNIYVLNTKQIEGGDVSWLDTHTAGTGPYVVDTWDPSTQVVLTPNTNYYKDAKVFSKVVFRYIPESSNRTLLLQNGDIDICMNIDSKDLETLKTNPKVTVDEMSSNRVAFFAFNNNTAPFDNVLVRQAISCAIPTDVLVQDVMEGNATQALGTLPIGIKTALNDGSAKPYTYDPDRAKELLAQAGYADGFTFDFELTSGYEDYADDAVVIQAELAKIGVTMNIVEVEYSTFLQDLIDGKAAAFIHSCTPYVPSPVYFYDVWFKSTGMMVRWAGFYNNPEVDSLLEEAKANPGTDTYTKDFEEIQRIIGEDVPWVPLYFYNSTVVYNQELQGFRFWNDANLHIRDLYW